MFEKSREKERNPLSIFAQSFYFCCRSSSIIYSPAGDQWGHPGSWRGVRIKLGSPQPAPLLVTPRCLILTLSWAKTTHARNWIHNQTHFQSSYCWRHFIRNKFQIIFSKEREKIQQRGKSHIFLPTLSQIKMMASQTAEILSAAEDVRLTGHWPQLEARGQYLNSTFPDISWAERAELISW